MRFHPLIATIVVATSTFAAHADTFTYTYTGNHFTEVSGVYTTSDFLSGSFTVSSPLFAVSPFNELVTPTSFSFFDGVTTYSSANGATEHINVQTDSSGNITTWQIQLFFGTTRAESILGSDNIISRDGSGDNVGNTGGTFKETINTTVPEPSTLALLGTGILGLAGVARRKLS